MGKKRATVGMEAGLQAKLGVRGRALFPRRIQNSSSSGVQALWANMGASGALTAVYSRNCHVSRKSCLHLEIRKSNSISRHLVQLIPVL